MKSIHKIYYHGQEVVIKEQGRKRMGIIQSFDATKIKIRVGDKIITRTYDQLSKEELTC